MVGYLDSSVLLEYILKNDQSISQVDACDFVISSELLQIECHRAVNRYRMERRLSDEKYYKAVMRLNKYISKVSLIILVDEIKQRAAEFFPMVIKTLDALHLASALAYQKRLQGEKIIVFSYDKKFNRCARALGFITPFLSEPE